MNLLDDMLDAQGREITENLGEFKKFLEDYSAFKAFTGLRVAAL